MQKTTNYNLNQWEATDRVTRADVNADNAKIDAALKGLDAAIAGAGMLTRLYDHTLAADAARFDLDVSAMGLANYLAMFVLIETNYEVSPIETYLYCNDDREAHYTFYTTNGAQDTGSLGSNMMPMMLLLWNQYGHSRTHCVNFDLRRQFPFHGNHTDYQKPMSEISTINFIPRYDNYNLLAGTRFSVYGLKR